MPQSLFSSCYKEVLKSLFDADNVGVAICVSGNFSRFNEGVAIWGTAKGAVEIEYEFAGSEITGDICISILSWLVANIAMIS